MHSCTASVANAWQKSIGLTSVPSAMDENAPQKEEKGLGAVVKEYRRRKGWSQMQLADNLEMSQRWLSDLERGVIKSPRIETLHRLAAILEVDVSELILKARLADTPEGAARIAALAPRQANWRFGDTIRSWRLGRGLTLGEMSEATGLSIQELEAVEADDVVPLYSVRKPIMDALWTTDDDLRPEFVIDIPSNEETEFYRISPEVAHLIAEIAESQIDRRVQIDHDLLRTVLGDKLGRARFVTSAERTLLPVIRECEWNEDKLRAAVGALRAIGAMGRSR